MSDKQELLPAYNNEEHSELGGSVIGVAFKCTGSIFLKRKIPQEKTKDKNRDSGSLIHDFSEVYLNDFLTYKRTGKDPKKRMKFKGVSSDSDDAVLIAKRYTDFIWRVPLQEYLTGKAYGTETKFWLHKNLNLFGKADFWTVYKGDKGERVGDITDLKSGWVKVNPNNNPQLGYYALGLRNYIRGFGKDLDYVIGRIFQGTLEDEEQPEEFKFTAKQLDRLEEKILDTAHKIYIEKEAKFKVGDWCRFCSAKAICPEYKKEIVKITGLKKIEDPSKIQLPAPESRTDEEVAKIVLYSEEIVNWVNKHKSYAMDRHLNNDPLPLLKLVEKSGRRSLIDDQDEIVQGLSLQGIPKEKLYDKKLKAMTKLEAIVGKDVMAPYILPGAPTVALVSAADPRPEATTPADLLTKKPNKEKPDEKEKTVRSKKSSKSSS